MWYDMFPENVLYLLTRCQIIEMYDTLHFLYDGVACLSSYLILLSFYLTGRKSRCVSVCLYVCLFSRPSSAITGTVGRVCVCVCVGVT